MKSRPAVPSSARNATDTRARIVQAARARFSSNSFEAVGLREIASDAGVDAALVSRYFGGKEGLFAAAIEGAFAVEDHVVDPIGQLGAHLARQVLAESPAAAVGGFDALQLLLRASAGPATAAPVAERFHDEFVRALAKRLRGRDAELRATLVAAQLIGLATARHALGLAPLCGASRRKAVVRAGAALQALLDG